MNQKLLAHVHTVHSGKLRHWVDELSRRRVGRAATTYAIVSWLNLQAADICIPLLDLPHWTMSLIVTLSLLGFPVVIALAWVFQITPRGVVIDVPGEEADQISPPAFFVVDAILLVLACLILILTLVPVLLS